MTALLLLLLCGTEVVPQIRQPLDELTCTGIGRAATAHALTIALAQDFAKAPMHTRVYGYDWVTGEAWELVDLRVKAWFMGGIAATENGFVIFDNLTGQITYLDQKGRFQRTKNWRNFDSSLKGFVMHVPWSSEPGLFYGTADMSGTFHVLRFNLDKETIEVVNTPAIHQGERYLTLGEGWVHYNHHTKFIALYRDGTFSSPVVVSVEREVLTAKNRPQAMRRKVGKNKQMLAQPVRCGNYITWRQRVLRDGKELHVGLRLDTTNGKTVETHLIPIGTHDEGRFLVFDLNLEELRVVSKLK